MHSSKTYLVALTNHEKTKEFLTFVNDKFTLAQTGSIRLDIGANRAAPALEEGTLTPLA